MSKVAVIGATGRTGQHIVKQLAANGFDVTGVVRNPSKGKTLAELSTASNIKFEVLALEDSVSKFALFLKDFDIVVYTAGANEFENLAQIAQVELDGALKLIEASEKAGLKRFILISSINASDRDFWYPIETIRSYYIAKRAADKFLERTALDFTIIEPGPLVDETGTGKILIPKEAYMASYEDFDFKDNYLAIKVSREDVARVVTESLKNDKTIRKTIPVIGGDTPIEKVISEYL